MTKPQHRIFASLCPGFSNYAKRNVYSLLALAIALSHIIYSTNIAIATPAALVNQGKIAYDRGDFPSAVQLWERAERGYQQARDPVGVAGSQIDRAQALMAMGFDRRACKLLTETVGANEEICTDRLPKLRQSNLPPTLRVLALTTLGDALRRLGNFDAAQTLLVQAIESAKPLGTNERAPIYIGIANTWRDLGTRDRDRTERLGTPAITPPSCPLQPIASGDAATYYQYAIACYRQAGTLAADLNSLSLQVEIGQWLRATTASPSTIADWQTRFDPVLRDRITQQVPSEPDTHTEASQQINFARSLALLPQPQWELAITLLNQAITTSSQKDRKLILTEATGTLGWLYEQKGERELALKFTQQAVDLAAGSTDRGYQWEWQLARIFQSQSDAPKSLAAYDRAIAASEGTRRNLRIVNPDAQFSLRDNVEPLYRSAIDLSLRQPQPNFPAIIDRLDALKLIELENFLQCQLGEYRSPNRAVANNAAIFYPVILADRLETILQIGNKFHRFVVPVRRSQLTATIDRFQTDLNQPQYGWNDDAASQLYDWLIRPAQPYLSAVRGAFLKENRQLVFVMDGALQNIPVAALFDRSTEQYLVDRYPVAVTPGLQILGAQSPQGDRSGILIGGLTTASGRKDGNRSNIYEPLTHATAEIRAIKSLFKRSIELVGRDFTATNLRQTLATGDYATLHLATHGRFSSDPRQNFIVTATDDKSIGTRDRIDLPDLQRILKQGKQKIDTIVLSACETATGDRRAALGLAGTAIQSGAASTIASLWAVDDLATAQLMREFYTSISRDRASKAAALRTAQRSIRQQYPHPYYWASFVLVGNWL